MRDGVSVVIPSMHQHRLCLLAATLASLRQCSGVEQIIIAEMGTAPCAAGLARDYGAEHVFTRMSGPFDRSRMMNAGTALARTREILWTDGDFLFEPQFIARAQSEMRASGADYFYPHSMMNYLGEADTREVLEGRRSPRDCHPIRAMAPRTGNPGGIGMVSADFVRRYGGMVDGFRGWGFEDHAWLRKATLLGTVDVSRDPAQHTWHLYHPDSGSHSERALREAARRNPHYAANAALMSRIQAVQSADEFLRQFPPSGHVPTPWPATTRIAFVVAAGRHGVPAAARADDWARRLHEAYGVEVPVVPVDPARPDEAAGGLGADAAVGFSDEAAGCHALMATLGGRLKLLVTDASGPAAMPVAAHRAPMILTRMAGQMEAWRERGLQVWHLPWGEDDAPGGRGAPPLAAPLSNLLGASRLWKIRIELDRAGMPPSALDRPRFWYVGLHDAGHSEMVRQDLSGPELFHVVTSQSEPIVIERSVAAPLPPATWTVWPTDRRGRWLDRLTGPADAEDLGHTWT